MTHQGQQQTRGGVWYLQLSCCHFRWWSCWRIYTATRTQSIWWCLTLFSEPAPTSRFVNWLTLLFHAYLPATFSGPDVCLSVSVWTVTSELNDVCPRYCQRLFRPHICHAGSCWPCRKSSLKVIIDPNFWSYDEKCSLSAMGQNWLWLKADLKLKLNSLLYIVTV